MSDDSNLVRTWWSNWMAMHESYSRAVDYEPKSERLDLREYVMVDDILPALRALESLYEEIHCQPDSPSIPDNKYHHILNAGSALAPFAHLLGDK